MIALGATSPLAGGSANGRFPPIADPRGAEIKKSASPESLSKTEVFERMATNRKVRAESGLNLSQNSFLILASQKVRWRLSFERVHDDQTDKDRSHGRAGQSTTPHCEEDRASRFDATR